MMPSWLVDLFGITRITSAGSQVTHPGADLSVLKISWIRCHHSRQSFIGIILLIWIITQILHPQMFETFIHAPRNSCWRSLEIQFFPWNRCKNILWIFNFLFFSIFGEIAMIVYSYPILPGIKLLELNLCRNP